MNRDAFTVRYEDLPQDLPVFPLRGALLLPGGFLPLNIFEPRYIAMIDAALRADRIIGMIQPRRADMKAETGPDDTPVYETGCAGRITAFEETPDGRYGITLQGLCRFRVVRELPMESGFRRMVSDWRNFRGDLEPQDCFGLDRARLTELLHRYFPQQGLTCEWEHMEGIPDEKLMTCLAMTCPLAPEEKQALLEAASCAARAEMFLAMLEIAIKSEETAGCNHCH